MKILIVGGCFTCQHNIEFNRLYHQTILHKFIKSGLSCAQIQTISYERIAKTIDKIETIHKDYKFDLLIFHLRAEPLMRMVKLYYKYLNDEGKLCHSLNLPFFRNLNAEKYDLLEVRRIINSVKNQDETQLHHSLRELNYYLGSIIGNKRRAMKSYAKFTEKIAVFCKNNSSDFLLLGPVSRPFSRFENKLSYEMSIKFNEFSKSENIKYLELLGESTLGNNPMFFPNGQHVSQEGHDEIAMKIYEKIKCFP